MVLLFVLFVWIPLLLGLSRRFGYQVIWNGIVLILALLFACVSITVAIN